MTSPPVFRFGGFELDVGAYVLRQSGRPVKLEQQPMDLLILLVERRPHLVTRAEITSRLWGADTFVEAETGINTAIRKVRQALGDAAADPLFIERVPGKGYRFVGEVVEGMTTDVVRGVAAPADRRWTMRWRTRLLVAIGGVAVIGAAVAVADAARRARRHTAPLHVEPLTRLAGSERDATLSPDARQVAFAWDGDREDNFDIYAMLVGSAHLVRLTTDPAADFSPQWSPDGRHIAYVRVPPPGNAHQLRVMTALGGDDRAVSDFPAWYQSSWSPDGRYLAVGRAVIRGRPSSDAGIYLVPLDGGAPRRLTQPSTGSDYSPAFSPDGTRLAYANCREITFRFECRVMVLGLDDRWQPRNSPRDLTRGAHHRIAGVAWSRDAASVLFGAGLPTSRLWRVSADGSAPAQIIEEAGEGAAYPARAADRLAFSRATYPNSVYRFERGRPSVPVARSAGQDGQPEYSSDGRRVAFCSDRSGTVEVWIAASDGSGPRQLTRGPGSQQCSPSWSADDRTIAYDSVDDAGYWQIWTIPVDGGQPRPITSGAADHHVPRWSRDGVWIYAASTRGGTRDIWRFHVQSGEAAQVTTGGSGFWSQESLDGRGVLYSGSNSQSPLMFQAYAGGPPVQLRSCLAAGSTVATAREGVYYLPCPNQPAADQPLQLFDPVTGRDAVVGRLEGYYRPRDFYSISFRRISLSPQDGSVLYIRRFATTADLLLIDGFR